MTRFRPAPWHTDVFVLLQLLACDNRTKADLSRLIGCVHEVQPIPRPRLCLVSDLPCKIQGLPDLHNLRHLGAAFPACSCEAAAFQKRFQIRICA